MCDSFSFNKMTIFINIALIQKFQNLNKKYKNESSENFCTLQTLFFPLKIAIFWRIAPIKNFKI